MHVKNFMNRKYVIYIWIEKNLLNIFFFFPQFSFQISSNLFYDLTLLSRKLLA